MTDTEDRPAKRVLTVGATQSVLDLASDRESRFCGMARDMLRAMLIERYLMPVCNKCHGGPASIAYWLERDPARVAVLDNTGREPVFMCAACTDVGRRCEHCYFVPLYHTRELLDQRLPAFEFVFGRDKRVVAAVCVADALRPGRAKCAQCGMPDFAVTLRGDGRSAGVYLCTECMKDRRLAPCDRCFDHIDERRMYCEPCAGGDPWRGRAVTRCTSPWCFVLTTLANTRCWECEHMIFSPPRQRVVRAESD